MPKCKYLNQRVDICDHLSDILYEAIIDILLIDKKKIATKASSVLY